MPGPLKFMSKQIGQSGFKLKILVMDPDSGRGGTERGVTRVGTDPLKYLIF